LAGLGVGRVGGPAGGGARLLAEVPFVVHEEDKAPPPAPAAVRKLRIGAVGRRSRVPDAWLQGVFLHPQDVSAVDISPDGRRVAVTTMAFSHDRNFWLLSDEGKGLASRY